MDRNEILMMRLSQLLNEIRQYVGARYVPRFIEGGWDATQAYEALDVVDNGQGTSYIAKKPVPVGTPLSDRTYWFIYGASSGAIINLQNQIDAIVNTTIPGINSEIDTLTNRLNSTKAILISDSFGTVQNTYNQTMLDIADLMTPRTVIKSAVSGSSFGGGNDFLTQLQAITDDELVSDIYVFGGPNDVIYTQSDIETGINAFVTYAKTHFPNAKIHLAYEGIHWTIPSYVAAAHSTTMYAYRSITVYGGDFVKDFFAIMHDPSLTYDGLHPTASGVNKLGWQIGRLLNGLPVDTYLDVAYEGSDCTAVSPVTSVDYVHVSERVENGIATLGSYQTGTIQVSMNPAVNITTFTSLFNVDKSAIYPTDSRLKHKAVPVMAKVFHSDSTITMEPFYLYKYNNMFSVSPAAGAVNDVIRLIILVPEIVYNTIEI